VTKFEINYLILLFVKIIASIFNTQTITPVKGSY